MVIPAGSSQGDTICVAAVPGAAGNLPAGLAFTTNPQPTSFVSATNLGALVSGRDAETPAERLNRFRGFISTLPRGTLDAIGYGVSTAALTDSLGNVIEAVQSSFLVEPYKADHTLSPGRILLYVHNGVGLTSGALVARAQAVVDGYYDPITGARVPGWKAAGVIVAVSAAADHPLDVAGVITVSGGLDLNVAAASVRAVLAAYLAGLPVGTPYQASVAAALILGIPGIANWQPLSPLVDVAAAADVKLLPGTFTIIPLPMAGTFVVSSALAGTLA
jgi:hypothetical protein